jgi:hypothetical protein
LIDVFTSDNKITQITLNNVIPTQQNAIVYTDNGNKIIVFVSPIYISSNSKNNIQNLSKQQLFNTYSSDYKVLPQTNISMAGNDEIYIDCSPTGASAEEIATYNVPINSEYTQDAGKLDFMKASIQLFQVIIFIVLIYFSVPFIYKTAVIDVIDKLIDGDTAKSSRNTTVDIILSFVAFIVFISIVFNAAKKEDYHQMLYGGYFILFCFLSIAIIGMNKIYGYFIYDWTTKDTTIQYDDILLFFGQLGLFIFKGPDDSPYTNIISIIVLYIITFIILLILRYGSKNISKNDFEYAIGIMAPIIIFGVSMTSLMKDLQ